MDSEKWQIVTPYTEQDHARGLLLILEMPKPCNECPRDRFFMNVYGESIYNWQKFNTSIGCTYGELACIVCRRFVHVDGLSCPCHVLDRSESIKRTWIALEEKGYLE